MIMQCRASAQTWSPAQDARFGLSLHLMSMAITKTAWGACSFEPLDIA